MNLHVLINLYNDYSTLAMAVHSIKDYASDITVADGAYELYYKTFKQSVPTAKPWSTDGSIEILKAIPAVAQKLKVIEPPNGEPWENQCVKRTALLDSVPEGEWFIILDADEMIYGNIPDAMREIGLSGCLAGSMPMYTPGLDAQAFFPNWHARVFLKLKGMHYSRKHWNLRDEHHRIVESHFPVKWTDQMVLVHLKVFRGLGRLMPHLGYMHMMSLDGWMEPQSIPQHFNIKEE